MYTYQLIFMQNKAKPQKNKNLFTFMPLPPSTSYYLVLQNVIYEFQMNTIYRMNEKYCMDVVIENCYCKANDVQHRAVKLQENKIK